MGGVELRPMFGIIEQWKKFVLVCIAMIQESREMKKHRFYETGFNDISKVGKGKRN